MEGAGLAANALAVTVGAKLEIVGEVIVQPFLSNRIYSKSISLRRRNVARRLRRLALRWYFGNGARCGARVLAGLAAPRFVLLCTKQWSNAGSCVSDVTESQIIERLVKAGAEGDKAAQEELLSRYWPLIQRVVRARRQRLGRELQLREDDDDLAQEVALELLQSLPKQKWQGSAAFAAWIRRLAEYQVIDAQRYHRRQKRDRRAETGVERADLDPAAARSAESVIDERRRMVALLESVADLKEEYGAALILHYQGYSHAQIGELLDCTAEAARKLVSRARAKLTSAAPQNHNPQRG